MAEEGRIRELFVDLERQCASENYARVIALADEILEVAPPGGGDADADAALNCKVVALLFLNKFGDALKTIEDAGAGGDFAYERAYCLFRTQKLEAALRAVTGCPENTFRVRELKAQILYRLERFGECTQLYQDLISEAGNGGGGGEGGKDDFEAERYTNLAAAYAGAAAVDPMDELVRSAAPVAQGTYELAYNEACLELARGALSAAASALERASVLCRETLEEEGDLTEEDIEAELALINVQQGVVHQMRGDSASAQALYTRILKTKPDDSSLAAVAANNVIALNGERDVFDSRKKIKAATGKAARAKFTKVQRFTVDLNECLLLMYAGQGDACRRRCAELTKTYPESDVPSLIHAALLLREKKADKARELLMDLDAPVPRLVLAQAQLQEGDLAGAAETLEKLGGGGGGGALSHQPAFVGLRVAIYTKLEQPDFALDALAKAVAYWAAHEEARAATTTNTEGGGAGGEAAETYRLLLREQGRFALAQGKAAVAADAFRALAEANPSDEQGLARLVLALAEVDVGEAEAVAEQLPPPNTQGTTEETDALEAAPVLIRRQAAAAAAATAAASTTTASGDAAPRILAKRKRKKRPGKLPKDYNPKVKPDPERWLPKWQRSTFKGRKKKKQLAAREVGKGTQGTAGMEAQMAALDASLKPTKQPEPAVATPSPAKKKQNKKKNKKKKR